MDENRDGNSKPLSQSLIDALIEEEELTSETILALHRAEACLDRGESISHEEILSEFDL